MLDSGTTVVSVGRLQAMADQVKNISGRITESADQMTSELQRTLAEWGEGTESRAAFNAFKARVDRCIAEMNEALALMPGAVNEAAASAGRTENRNTALFR
ncbi:MAG TPA: WXG100 family type VII secretion target [Dermatophilaceae bacterium]|jgi:uncharacterized protein YukE|nr:WXG100 family type VII secretion target [Actinomycetales bacterium]HMT33526.1 WXG100 family type VII secretion target [Dermatophilaceae bacterium]HMT90703.1 WXG100 family type VII secretion target [Dermatophilaceae bacterium]